ncbi:sensor domain-containing diguanylate cyclase [Rhodococcoides kyotonense]|uniref:PAS domain S-box-containing protein/diguanylate cyclase (GGDEF) domain-containing protein n=1 Tax=Rhodococcoides kyotonense TaxID=398843 RepID=A0A239FJS5_9NOCA|nr:sensor domain-containing diguanylate cyclase [Rhodococcus kyotonensis]SNS57190.1 PAS domain S-box-containing protein/diguanylate cyclase (GGDEF) domain-containing protein [Rhodococcus kyotonensis]
MTHEVPRPDPSNSVGDDEVAAADLADRYRLLVEHTPDAIVVHQFGVIRWMNPAGLRYLEADSIDQVNGRFITDFIDPSSIGPMLERIAGLDGHGAVSKPSEAVVITLGGARIPAEAVSVRTSWNGEPAFQVILRDLTEHKAAQESLRYHAALVNHVSDAIVGVAPDGKVSAWNPAAEQVYGRPAAAVVGRSLSTAFGVPCDPSGILAAGGRVTDTHVHADGSALSVTVSAAQMDDGFVLVCSDQTAVRQAERHFTTVVEALNEGVVVVDHTGRITSANLSAKRVLDVETGTLTRQNDDLPFRVFNTDHVPITPAEHPVVIARQSRRPASAVVGVQRRRDGRRFWVWLTATLLDPGASSSAVVTTFTDVTEQHEAGLELAHAASHDDLTGLPNRTLLLERLGDDSARRYPLAVLFIDLDHFKTINDTHGHAVGDEALCAVAQRLTAALTPDSMVGRIGGDEFVAVVPAGRGSEADDIRTALSTPIVVRGQALTIAASIGRTTVARNDRRTAREILHDADVEMYQAKPVRQQG